MRDPALALAIRVAIVVALAAGILLGRRARIAWQQARRGRALNSMPLPELAGDHPAVLLFTGTLCSDCARQKAALDQLHQNALPFRTREIHAAREPRLALRFGISSVPATVVLDPDGRPVSVNYGFVEGDLIARQLAEASQLATA